MTSNDLMMLGWKMLGWFAASLLFIFAICLVLTGAVICADVAVIIYQDVKGRIRNKNDKYQ